ncbi:MAG TPA: CBS domain-containing protein [Candidatus Intestinimonas pullistercoris]|uniref:CBS domain-containing protein n=1 Tax=Candidatus Intestinimonas pullistercoris TaxID=2838623 RepID=A0A9D2NYK1_9FIRM|nr:CBS domain-containing protein [uncultured Intestinimonas sp.]HJC40825.1 CBS domain-containing protein [Candidatus Intestinimonas pullistercoris]
MQVRELMNQSVVSITPGESASLAARLLARHQLGALPVCGEDGGLRGIVTDRDIVTRCVAAETDPHKVPVREIMSRNCAVISPEEDAAEAARLMGAGQVRRLPVLEDGKVVGMVSLGDLAKCRACDMEAAEALSEISENIHRPPTSGPSD